MRLLTGLSYYLRARGPKLLGGLGLALAAVGCGSDKERTSTINNLSDGGLVTIVDAGVEAGTGPTKPELTSTAATTSGVATSTTSKPNTATTSTATPTPTTNEVLTTVETSSAPNESSDTVETTTTDDSMTDAGAPTSTSSSDAGTDQTSAPPVPESCGNGELDGAEMCCTQSAIDAELEVRTLAAELLLSGDLGCAATTSSSENGISYEMCGGSCGTDTGCEVTASNVTLSYDPTTRKLNGTADIQIDGRIVLEVAALQQRVSCDTASVLFEGATFSGDVVTDMQQLQTIVTVENVATETGQPAVSGCAQGAVLDAAFVLLQDRLQAAVTAAVEEALQVTFAQPIDCPI